MVTNSEMLRQRRYSTTKLATVCINTKILSYIIFIFYMSYTRPWRSVRAIKKLLPGSCLDSKLNTQPEDHKKPYKLS